jgi:AraC-like DNA-binding protein
MLRSPNRSREHAWPPPATMESHRYHLKQPFALDIQRTEEQRSGFHMHNGMELGVCVSGQAERRVGAYRATLTEGQAWLVGLWEPHAWVIPPGAFVVHFYFVPEVLWDPSEPALPWLHMFSAAPASRPQAESPAAREQILTIAREVAEEAERQEIGWLRLGRLALMRVLTILEREWQRAGRTSSHSGIVAEDVVRLARAVELANWNLDRRVPATEAAAACYLSTSRFQHLFRETFGVSYGRFSLRTRLAAAMARLLQSDTSIGDLANEFGFADASHLRRAFVAEYGLTPSDLRKHQ